MSARRAQERLIQKKIILFDEKCAQGLKVELFALKKVPLLIGLSIIIPFKKVASRLFGKPRNVESFSLIDQKSISVPREASIKHLHRQLTSIVDFSFQSRTLQDTCDLDYQEHNLKTIFKSFWDVYTWVRDRCYSYEARLLIVGNIPQLIFIICTLFFLNNLKFFKYLLATFTNQSLERTLNWTAFRS